MAGGRDPAIKLFGRTIQFSAGGYAPAAAVEERNGDEEKFQVSSPESEVREAVPNSPEEERKTETIVSSPEKNSKTEESNNSQENLHKKPDKILSCPRCNSMDTKFCYYNNYNVNQPRHFCRNCQRYWTAGGSMRNVPVGAGRRKSKSSSANHHIRQLAIPDSTHHLNSLKSNGTVLSFGQPMTAKSHGEAQSSVSSVTASNSNDERNRANSSGPYLGGTPWPYTWSHPPPFCASSFPVPFYPFAAYWGLPWSSPSASNWPSSSTLGKHSRDGNSEKENSLWAPKTSRIEDSETAAKFADWATLGLQSNKEIGSNMADASRVLLANPAALSRFLSFHESS
ncbi:hypothetical protein HPP92_015606 [Vanilla planifolia]|uniref:Dof-type domain-containing protein n=1 Tax=Vanilla planifolia TaxID=51239 RepID=A0A835QIC7_VANPL|nr:hypothetical protein HPP92_016260 [Vanilla planifolia]KAG0471060.1 hypothetical protein HPP92_015606 [Vanilla planifolia]